MPERVPKRSKAKLVDMAADETRDAILRGRLVLWQPRRGYRFNVDSLLLADFVAQVVGARLGRVVDLCAGVGVIGLALAVHDASADVTLVELQERVAAFALRNVLDNQLAARARVVKADLGDARGMRAAIGGARFDLVVSSPPFFRLADGPPVPDAEEAIARHELRLTLADVVRESRRLLVPGGRAAYVYPTERLVELLALLDGAGLRPVRLQAIHARASDPAERVLVLAQKRTRAISRGGLAIDPPLIVRDESGYTPAARRALGE